MRAIIKIRLNFACLCVPFFYHFFFVLTQVTHYGVIKMFVSIYSIRFIARSLSTLYRMLYNNYLGFYPSRISSIWAFFCLSQCKAFNLYHDRKRLVPFDCAARFFCHSPYIYLLLSSSMCAFSCSKKRFPRSVF